MFGTAAIKRKIADGLIGKWLRGQKLQQGEDKAVLMMYEEQHNGKPVTMLLVTAVKIEDGSLKVVRVIESVNVAEAL